MGVPSSGGNDVAEKYVTGAISSATQGAGTGMHYLFNVSVWGTFVATWSLERTFDGGTTWLNASTNALGTPNSFTGPATFVCDEPESGVQYRVNVTSYTSGTVNWRLSK